MTLIKASEAKDLAKKRESSGTLETQTSRKIREAARKGLDYVIVSEMPRFLRDALKDNGFGVIRKETDSGVVHMIKWT